MLSICGIGVRSLLQRSTHPQIVDLLEKNLPGTNTLAYPRHSVGDKEKNVFNVVGRKREKRLPEKVGGLPG